MKAKQIFLAFALIFSLNWAMAQDPNHFELNAETNGTAVHYEGNASVTDDGGGAGAYTAPQSYSMTVVKDDVCDSSGHKRMGFTFEVFDIDPRDTLFIYDGPSMSSPLLLKCNNNLNNMYDKTIFVSPSNNTQSLTIFFKVGNHEMGCNGFSIKTTCAVPCEKAVPVIDSIFYRAHDGVPFKKYFIHDEPQYDSIDGERVIVGYYPAVDLCAGSGAILTGHGEYTSEHGYYDLKDENVKFMWHFGNFYSDSVVGIGATEAIVRDTVFRDPMCYDASLQIDPMIEGCPIFTATSVKVRVAKKPLTPYNTNLKVRTICNRDSILLSPEADDAFRIFFDTVEGVSTTSKINDVRTFIPDGKYCDDPCFVAPVTFTEFPVGRNINLASDICSICINYEHEFMGDYRLALVCPNGSRAVLKYGNHSYDQSCPQECPDYNEYGSGTFTGYPYGGDGHHSYDGSGDGICDSTDNPYGVGLDYCWSRNRDYTLVTGDRADVPQHFQTGQWYLGSSNVYIDQVSYTFDPVPVQFTQAGQAPSGVQTFSTKHPSNHEEKLDYYSPASDFSELVGCPLNGEWNVEVCDYWGSDNGWVFNWSMDICGVSYDSECEYKVNVDSVLWKPDSTYGDTLLGYYRGLQMHMADSMSSYMLSPDTAGTFPVLITIVDDFGCYWDTSTTITTVWTPEPNLPPVIHLCSATLDTLDATDYHARNINDHSNYKYTYMWEPNGQTTDTIHTELNRLGTRMYVVEVTNTGFENTRCVTRDTTVMHVNQQPVPNFDANVFPFEGCEPFTLSIENNTKYATSHLWIFGDGHTSRLQNPTHTYAAGTYDFKYYATSDSGCVDSLVYTNLVSVYSHPVAGFSWDPMYPTVLNPSIQLTNFTNPKDSNNIYYWEFQYDKNNPYSFHTQTDENPTFTWVSPNGEDPTGTYKIRLIARTDNNAPSGALIQCADTAENSVLLVNDFLQFPNAITPNGDGINDIFEIKNLIDGLGYPNNRLDIYNRWGSCVYHKENITSREDFWDPAATNTPSGTYFFKFTAVGYNGNIERSGSIEVLR